MQKLLNIKEAAAYLRISQSTIYKLVEKDKIPAKKVGGAWRFQRTMLDDWLKIRSTRHRETILVVDDDIKIRNTLSDIIASRGYQVITVENGEKAIAALESLSLALVFLDLMLPDLTGVEVLRRIEKKTKKPVIVIVTGYGDDPIAMEAMSMGPLLLMRKPFRLEDVQKVLNIVMKGT
ncbi:response regulator [Chloroflexota bacterium]